MPVCIGPAVNAALSSDISFSGLTLAVSAPEGDSVPELVESYAAKLSDVSQYCSFVAMDEDDARAALEAGEVTAVLCLPEEFVHGIMYGTNPDVRLIVPDDRPLETLLTLWVGQCAADLLASVQAGTYAVQELYETMPAEGLTWDRVMTDINLRYISWTLNRQNLFEEKHLTATEQLPVGLHYGLSLLGYLGLTAAPLISAIYTRRSLVFRKRLRALGRGKYCGFGSDLTACTVLLFAFSVIPIALLTKGSVPAVAAAALGFALLCALFGMLCALLTSDTAACGGLSFVLALVFLAVGGGILPPVLLPQTLRSIGWLSPVSWLRTVGAVPAGYDADARMLAAAALAAALMAAAAAVLYARRLSEKEGAE